MASEFIINEGARIRATHPSASIYPHSASMPSLHIFFPYIEDGSSFVLSGSQNAKMYFSGSTSGKLGIGTTNPTNDVDIKADSFKVRSKDGTKEIEFGEEGQLRTRKFSGVGALGATETSGSEVVLSYSPGTFASPVRARAGDVMGSIRWEDESYGTSLKRSAATPVQIDGIITAATPDGVTGYISVKTTAALDVGPVETVGIRTAGIYVTGSMNVSLSLTATHITASGNVSSSGTVIANAFTGPLTGTATGLTGTPDIVVGSLTATSITSSIVTSSILYTEGSNIFGNALNDTHLFNGSITASGNISSSGNVYAADYFDDGTNISSIYSARIGSGAITTLGTIGAGTWASETAPIASAYLDTHTAHLSSTQTFLGAKTFTLPVTASSNISASGNVYAADYFDNGTNINTLYDLTPAGTYSSSLQILTNITASGGISSTKTITAEHFHSSDDITVTDNLMVGSFANGVTLDKDTGITATGAAGNITASGNISASGNIINTGNLTTTHITALGHTTASGNISSSGNVIADFYKVGNNTALSYNTADLFLGNANYWDRITYGRQNSDQHIVIGNITASGNISSSGTVTGLSGSFSHILGNSPITVQDTITFQSSSTFIGDVTASGNISASGNIYSANEKTIAYSVYTKSTRADRWWGPKKFGTQGSGLWNQAYTDAGSGTSPSRLFLNTGFAITEKAKFVRFQVSALVNTGTANLPITASFAVSDSALDTDNTTNPSLVHLDSGSAITDSGGDNYDQIQISSSLGAGTVIPKNSMIYPRFKWGTDQTANPGTIGSAELYLQVQFTYIPIK